MSRVLGSWTLPLREASGLAVRRNPSGVGHQLLAVEDDLFAVATAGIAGGVLTPDPDAIDIRAAMKRAGAHRGGSDFEGVATDGPGTLFLLQEDSSRIVVLEPHLGRVAGLVPLIVRPDDPVVGADWHGGRNARGEGLVLLRGGHVLLAMQQPPAIIEFGAAGDAATGFRPGDAISADDTFAMPSPDASFGVLAAWPIGGAAMQSVNDLTVGADGRLHAVSSASRCVARIAVDLAPAGGSAEVVTWPLPRELFASRRHKAEGLAWAPGLGLLVALDIGRAETNLFLVEDRP